VKLNLIVPIESNFLSLSLFLIAFAYKDKSTAEVTVGMEGEIGKSQVSEIEIYPAGFLD
jgi:hypothetical protein